MILNPKDKENNVFVSADNSFVMIFNPSQNLTRKTRISLLKKINTILKGNSKTLKK